MGVQILINYLSTQKKAKVTKWFEYIRKIYVNTNLKPIHCITYAEIQIFTDLCFPAFSCRDYLCYERAASSLSFPISIFLKMAQNYALFYRRIYLKNALRYPYPNLLLSHFTVSFSTVILFPWVPSNFS